MVTAQNRAGTRGDERTRDEPRLVEVPAADFVAIEGTGAPESPDFAACVAALYACSYPVVIALNRIDGPRRKVGPLEGLWWADGDEPSDPTSTDRTAWHWRLMIAHPDQVPATLQATAREKVARKLGGDLDGRLAVAIRKPPTSPTTKMTSPIRPNGTTYPR